MSQKSYNNSPSLYLIPTPIGNMDDITLRAIKVFQEVEVIFSEDTRVTGLLLNHLGIKKKMISNHKFNEHNNKDKMLAYLKDGKSVGLVSDRGTPVISDPGYELVDFVISQGYNVIALPGASAFICALITSGLSSLSFSFHGFLNSKQSKRRNELKQLKEKKETLIFYESPHRIVETMEDILLIFGDRKCSISREITKKFEEIYRGNISNVLKEIVDVKGEIVIVLDGNKEEKSFDEIDVCEQIGDYIGKGMSSKEAIKLVAKERKLSKNDVYMEYHNKELK